MDDGSVQGFKFQKIGKQPGLLQRMRAPAANMVYRSPTPENRNNSVTDTSSRNTTQRSLFERMGVSAIEDSGYHHQQSHQDDQEEEGGMRAGSDKASPELPPNWSAPPSPYLPAHRAELNQAKTPAAPFKINVDHSMVSDAPKEALAPCLLSLPLPSRQNIPLPPRSAPSTLPENPLPRAVTLDAVSFADLQARLTKSVATLESDLHTAPPTPSTSATAVTPHSTHSSAVQAALDALQTALLAESNQQGQSSDHDDVLSDARAALKELAEIKTNAEDAQSAWELECNTARASRVENLRVDKENRKATELVREGYESAWDEMRKWKEDVSAEVDRAHQDVQKQRNDIGVQREDLERQRVTLKQQHIGDATKTSLARVAHEKDLAELRAKLETTEIARSELALHVQRLEQDLLHAKANLDTAQHQSNKDQQLRMQAELSYSTLQTTATQQVEHLQHGIVERDGEIGRMTGEAHTMTTKLNTWGQIILRLERQLKVFKTEGKVMPKPRDRPDSVEPAAPAASVEPVTTESGSGSDTQSTVAEASVTEPTSFAVQAEPDQAEKQGVMQAQINELAEASICVQAQNRKAKSQAAEIRHLIQDHEDARKQEEGGKMSMEGNVVMTDTPLDWDTVPTRQRDSTLLVEMLLQHQPDRASTSARETNINTDTTSTRILGAMNESAELLDQTISANRPLFLDPFSPPNSARSASPGFPINRTTPVREAADTTASMIPGISRMGFVPPTPDESTVDSSSGRDELISKHSDAGRELPIVIKRESIQREVYSDDPCTKWTTGPFAHRKDYANDGGGNVEQVAYNLRYLASGMGANLASAYLVPKESGSSAIVLADSDSKEEVPLMLDSPRRKKVQKRQLGTASPANSAVPVVDVPLLPPRRKFPKFTKIKPVVSSGNPEPSSVPMSPQQPAPPPLQLQPVVPVIGHPAPRLVSPIGDGEWSNIRGEDTRAALRSPSPGSPAVSMGEQGWTPPILPWRASPELDTSNGRRRNWGDVTDFPPAMPDSPPPRRPMSPARAPPSTFQSRRPIGAPSYSHSRSPVRGRTRVPSHQSPEPMAPLSRGKRAREDDASRDPPAFNRPRVDSYRAVQPKSPRRYPSRSPTRSETPYPHRKSSSPPPRRYMTHSVSRSMSPPAYVRSQWRSPSPQTPPRPRVTSGYRRSPSPSQPALMGRMSNPVEASRHADYKEDQQGRLVPRDKPTSSSGDPELLARMSVAGSSRTYDPPASLPAHVQTAKRGRGARGASVRGAPSTRGVRGSVRGRGRITSGGGLANRMGDSYIRPSLQDRMAGWG